MYKDLRTQSTIFVKQTIYHITIEKTTDYALTETYLGNNLWEFACYKNFKNYNSIEEARMDINQHLVFLQECGYEVKS